MEPLEQMVAHSVWCTREAENQLFHDRSELTLTQSFESFEIHATQINHHQSISSISDASQPLQLASPVCSLRITKDDVFVRCLYDKEEHKAHYIRVV